jgi:NitT/TauT family transport system substrate-binding protein/sulfonate transport system substrate-binding protein
MKRIVGLFAAAALAALPAASGGQAPAQALKEIRVSYVRSPFNLPLIVAARRGMLKDAFAEKGVALRFLEIDSGAKQAEAMAAESLDIASVINTTSVILAAAGGNGLKIVAGFSRPAGLFAIVVRDPSIHAIADLKGKRVAGPKGTVLHQLLAAGLARAGLGLGDVDFLQMDIPAAGTALISGQVDAALLAASSVLAAEAAGARVLATAEGYVRPQLVVAARPAFLRDHPELVALYLSVLDSARAWMRAHEEEALAMGAKEEGIGVEEARALAMASHFTASIGPDEVEAMAEDVRFMLGAGMLSAAVDPATLLGPGLPRR